MVESIPWGEICGDEPERPSRCSYCGFRVAEKAGGLSCKSGEACPFSGKTIEYLAPPGPRPRLSWLFPWL